MVFYLYVVDERRHLVGVTSLRRLLLVSPETPLKRIMTPDVISARVDIDQEEVARQVAVLQPAGDPGRRRGEQAGRRHHRRRRHRRHQGRGDRGHLSRWPACPATSASFTPACESLRKRLPWLGVNLVTAFLAASVVALFEGTIEQVTALAVFMPIVAGMGGNAAHADADGHRPRHRARRADVGQRAQGADQGGARSASATASCSASSRRWCAWADARATRCSGLLLGMAMVINMFVAATAGTLVPLGLQGAEGRPGAGLVGVHHDADRRRRLLLVPGAGDDVRCGI